MGYSVVVLNDHALFSTALMLALRASGLDAHRGDLACREAVLGQLERLTPGVVLLDLHLGRTKPAPRISVPDLIDALVARRWSVLVVIDDSDEAQIAAAIAAGAAGTVSRSSSLEDLLATVLAAAAGHAVMTEAQRSGWMTSHRHHQAQKQRVLRLNTRELEVLSLLAGGHRASAVADRLMVELPTVRAQIRVILAKLEVGSQLEAVLAVTERE